MVRPKLRPLRVFLLKDRSGLPRSALKKPNQLARHGIRPRLPFKGSLWVRPQRPGKASWADFVAPNVTPDLVVVTSTSAAVLLVEAAGRWFAFVFGYGGAVLDRSAFERDFGLKITLNAVNPEGLRSIDAKTFESPLTLLTRRQTSRASSLDAFGLNVSHDLVRAVAGDPEDEAFAHRLAGSDALAFTSRVEFEDLARKCEALLEMHGRSTYRKHFPFVDRLRRITDPGRIQQLEEKLESHFNSAQFDRMHLAPPEITNPESVEGVSYSTEPDRTFPDFDLAEFLSTLNKRSGTTYVDALRRNYVTVHFAEGAAVETWTVLECLTAEIEEADGLFVLSGGEWFEADRAFAAQTTARVQEIASNPLELLPAKVGETEPHYNSRVGRRLGHVVLDGELARCDGATSPIEVCDLLTADRQFVHVKRKTRSATLSHLFAQGVVAAESFLYDAVFRQDARDLIEARKRSMVDVIPTARPPADQYEVAYAVIARRMDSWPKTLPFFSQVNLCNAADRLKRLGFKVSITGVPEL